MLHFTRTIMGKSKSGDHGKNLASHTRQQTDAACVRPAQNSGNRNQMYLCSPSWCMDSESTKLAFMSPLLTVASPNRWLDVTGYSQLPRSYTREPLRVTAEGTIGWETNS